MPDLDIALRGASIIYLEGLAQSFEQAAAGGEIVVGPTDAAIAAVAVRRLIERLDIEAAEAP